MIHYISEAQLIYILKNKKNVKKESIYEDIYTEDFKTFYIYKEVDKGGTILIKEYVTPINNKGSFKCSNFIYETKLNFKSLS